MPKSSRNKNEGTYSVVGRGEEKARFMAPDPGFYWGGGRESGDDNKRDENLGLGSEIKELLSRYQFRGIWISSMVPLFCAIFS